MSGRLMRVATNSKRPISDGQAGSLSVGNAAAAVINFL
jgi:hypothetical protein